MTKHLDFIFFTCFDFHKIWQGYNGFKVYIRFIIFSMSTFIRSFIFTSLLICIMISRFTLHDQVGTQWQIFLEKMFFQQRNIQMVTLFDNVHGRKSCIFLKKFKKIYHVLIYRVEKRWKLIYWKWANLSISLVTMKRDTDTPS